jgi:hypothetical protein
MSPLPPIDGIVSQHNPTKSGAARFNEVLAQRLGVPLVDIDDEALDDLRCPLVSLKFAELDREQTGHLADALRGDGSWRALQLFLHEYSGLPLENELIRRAERVLCGNREIERQVRTLNPRREGLWAPGLILDTRRFEPVAISVFSFGMAHKIRTAMYRRLKRLLDGSGQSYALYFSNAHHETATLEDALVVQEEMHAIFPEGLYFMGNLSDVAVYNYLLQTTFFAAFFPKGARANNSSLSSAMEHGAVIITNLDEHSPPHLRHLETVIDINRCEELPLDPALLGRISTAAVQAARSLSWERLTERVRNRD